MKTLRKTIVFLTTFLVLTTSLQFDLQAMKRKLEDNTNHINSDKKTKYNPNLINMLETIISDPETVACINSKLGNDFLEMVKNHIEIYATLYAQCEKKFDLSLANKLSYTANIITIMLKTIQENIN